MSVLLRIIFLNLAFATSLFLMSCGYQIGQGNGKGGLPSRYSTISVPYIKGDLDGTLTSAIIREIVRSGAFQYKYSGGDLVLNATKVEIDEDNIGFRYDQKKRGSLTKDIIPIETRITIFVEVKVVEAISCTTVLGPILLSASVDYDHDYYFKPRWSQYLFFRSTYRSGSGL